MTELEKKYFELLKEREKILDEINEMHKIIIIQKYNKLKRRNANLEEKQNELYEQLQMEKYENCDHIFVRHNINHDSYEGRVYPSCGCIKCGLDTSILSKVIEQGYDINDLSTDQQIMYNYLKELYDNNIFLNIAEPDITTPCNLELATAIYKKIKEAHPDIDDDTTTVYFEIALDNMRYKPVTEERQISRAKRLGLSKNFKNWDCSDVHHW